MQESERKELLRQLQLPASELLMKGIREFNAGEYFEQHETLETAWRAEPGPIRILYQGILQVGVAYYHIQRRNHTGAIKVLLRAQEHLAELPDNCQGVNIARLRGDVTRVLAEVERLGPSHIALFNPVFLKPIQFTGGN